jgi:spermidine synthase
MAESFATPPNPGCGPSSDTHRGALALPFIILGFTSQVAQIVLLRELLTVFYGNEMSIGVILACWMLWIAAGSWLGGLVADRLKNPVPAYLVCSAIAALLLPVEIWHIRVLRDFVEIMPGEYFSVFSLCGATLILFGVFCPFVGAQFALGSRIWHVNRPGRAASSVYALECAGSVIGGVACTVMLALQMHSFQLALTVWFANVAGTFCLAFTGRREENREGQNLHLVGAGTLMFFACLLASPFADRVNSAATGAMWKGFFKSPIAGVNAVQYRLVESRESKYCNISVLERQGQYTVFMSGHRAFTLRENGETCWAADIVLAQHENPKAILVIGGAMNGWLARMLRHPIERIDYVELDPALMEMCLPHMLPEDRNALDDPRVSVIHADGRLWIRKAARTYDMVIVNASDPLTAMMNRYYTTDFFRDVRSILGERGVFALNGLTWNETSPDEAMLRRNRCVAATLKSVFADVVSTQGGHICLFASNTVGQICLLSPTDAEDENDVTRRLRARGVGPEAFWIEVLGQDLGKTNRRLGLLAGDSAAGRSDKPGYGGLNTDERPSAYIQTILSWHRYSRTKYSGALDWMQKIRPASFWPVPAVMVVIAAALVMFPWARRRGLAQRYCVIMAVLAGGLAGMVLEIVVMFAFQSVYGYVYSLIGILFAVFMAGLAAGAWAAGRMCREGKESRQFAVTALMLGSYALVLPLMLKPAGAMTSPALTMSFFSALMFVSGGLVGAIFPTGNAVYLKFAPSAARTAGVVYAADVAGGCVGALLASAVVVPVLGVVWACVLTGAFCLVAAAMLPAAEAAGRSARI